MLPLESEMEQRVLDQRWVPIADRTAEELLATAQELRESASTATSAEVVRALLQLADRFEDAAAKREPKLPESPQDCFLPGERVPKAGQFEELNVFGTPSGRAVRLEQGQTLPASPRGFTWRTVAR